MRSWMFLATIALMFMVLLGCQSSNDEIELLAEVSEISLAESNGYGGLNEDYFFSSRERDTIINIESIMKSAKAGKENLENQSPDYDLLVKYKDGSTQGFHLLLGKNGEKSALMYIGHEGKAFSVNEEGTEKLRDVVKSAK